jgi:(heptosyl)LPS beta-1,4-glucosyltransferase
MFQHQSVNGSDRLATRHSVRRRMTWDRRLPDDVVSALWDSPENLLRQGKCLQSKSRTTVARVDFGSGSYLLKFHHWAGFWKTVTKSLAVSPNRRSFNDGVKLVDGGVPTPLPLACVDVRLGPLNVCSYLLTEFVSGTSLYRRMRFGEPDAAAVDHFARQVADIWHLLDDLQFCHNDLKPENLMIDDVDRVWLIDLENGRWIRDRRLLSNYQREDAKRLLHMRSWKAKPQAAERFRQRLLATPAVQALADAGNRHHPLESVADIGGGIPEALTVFIPCLNAVNDIRGCIEAVRDFADEILVADAGSNDGTLQQVESFADCRVIPIDSLDPDMQRRRIAEASHPWVLLIEPIERVSSDLAKEIQFLMTGSPSSDGFRIERRCHFFGHVIRFGDSAGGTPVRLVRRDCYALLDANQLKSEKRSEKITKLRCTIECRISSIEQFTAALTNSAKATANEWHARGRQPSLLRVLLHGPLNFVRSYFIKLGCLDGLAGLHFALMSAVFVYVSYAKLWQLQHGLPNPDGEVTQPTAVKLVAPEASSEESLSAQRGKAA